MNVPVAWVSYRASDGIFSADPPPIRTLDDVRSQLYGLTDNACHVILRVVDPRSLSQI